MMSDWPWVMGNLGALFGGTIIAFVGSVIWPNTDFKWEHLNETIPLVDDLEPPPEDEIYREEAFLSFMTKASAGASIGGTILLIFLWPIPMHLWSGVFSEAGFTVWIVLDFLWLVAAGGVIIVLPAYELRNVFSEYKAKVDNLKLKPGSSSKVVESVENGEHKEKEADVKTEIKDKKKVTELQNKVKEMEEAAKKAQAATEKSAKDFQQQIEDLKEENKKAVAAAKKAAAKPAPAPKPKVLPKKKSSGEAAPASNEAAKTETAKKAPEAAKKDNVDDMVEVGSEGLRSI